MSVTIAFIAEKSGVSKSTVSRYINGGYVSAKTADKIAFNIEKYNYVPNKFAQSLKARHSQMIGVIIPRIDSFAVQKTLLGIEETLKKENYKLLISSSSQKVDEELTAIKMFQSQKVDGIILLATSLTKKHDDIFKNSKIPILIIGQESTTASYYSYNDVSAGYQMAKHCLDQKLMDVHYIGVSESDRAVGILRKRGVELIQADQALFRVTYHEADFSAESASIIAREIFKEKKVATILCATDNLALAVLKETKKQGIHVPDQVKIIGCGNYEISTLTHPELTTVSFPYQKTGKEACESLFSLMRQEVEDIRRVVEVELIVRESA